MKTMECYECGAEAVRCVACSGDIVEAALTIMLDSHLSRGGPFCPFCAFDRQVCPNGPHLHGVVTHTQP